MTEMLIKVCEENGEIRLIPIRETNIACPLFGMFADGKVSVDKFIANKRLDEEDNVGRESVICSGRLRCACCPVERTRSRQGS